MTFRTRLLIAFGVVTFIPLSLLGYGVRGQLATRVGAQFERRVAAQLRVAEQDLLRESASIAQRLAAVARALATDDRFRAAVVRGMPSERAYVLDYAERAMAVTGLAMLQLQDAGGRILSSGHFRNEFDRLDAGLPALLAGAPGSAAIVRARSPGGPFLALARTEPFDVGGRRFDLVGGVAIDSGLLARLHRDDGVTAQLSLTPAATPQHTDRDRIVGVLPVSFADAGVDPPAVRSAVLSLIQPVAELRALERDVNRWFAVALVTALAGALALAFWLSARLSGPLAALAASAAAFDLDRPGVAFATGRRDEIGALARYLDATAARLRRSVARLRDAERRATVGDLARQVNHDIKNGLIPIRNVVRHLSDVQEQQPEALALAFADRRATLDSSLGYLDALARSYARLSPRAERRAVDVNAVVRDVAQGTDGSGGIRVVARLTPGLPTLAADPLMLRRLLDNLVRNGVECFDGTGRHGTVTIDTLRDGRGVVRVVVSDDGPGMTDAELARVFTDFYSTKPQGSGLGLSVVRRLALDMQGEVRVESRPGSGSRFTVELPVAPHAA
jgi:signal transduction histidine kinase